METLVKSLFMGSVSADNIYFDTSEWKILLSRMSEENVQLKNQLSTLLNREHPVLPLQQAEEFQSRFIWEDEHILFLRNIIRLLDATVPGNHSDAVDFHTYDLWVELTQKRIGDCQKQFDSLKEEFYICTSLYDNNRSNFLF